MNPYNQIDDYGQDKSWKMQKQAQMMKKRKSQIASAVEVINLLMLANWNSFEEVLYTSFLLLGFSSICLLLNRMHLKLLTSRSTAGGRKSHYPVGILTLLDLISLNMCFATLLRKRDLVQF